jgi:hypothetical protein
LSSQKWYKKVRADEISIIAAILTIIQSLIVFVTLMQNGNEFNGSELPFYSTVIAVNVVNLGLIFALMRLIKRNDNARRLGENLRKEHKFELKILEDDNEDLRDQIDFMQASITALTKSNKAITHELKILKNRILIAIASDNTSDYHSIKTDVKSFLVFYTANLKNFFDKHTGDECAIYITMLTDESADPQDKYCETFFRDPTSYVERQHIDKKRKRYLAKEFFPFKEITSYENGLTSFQCEDCNDLKHFHDRIPEWDKFFKAVISTPIQKPVKGSDGMVGNNTIGFLTVDNMKGGLSDLICLNCLKAYSDVFYDLLNTLFYLEEKVKKGA